MSKDTEERYEEAMRELQSTWALRHDGVSNAEVIGRELGYPERGIRSSQVAALVRLLVERGVL